MCDLYLLCLVAMYSITGTEEIQAEAELEFTAYPFQTTQQDRHQMHFEYAYIPLPKVSSHASFRFSLSFDDRIMYVISAHSNACLCSSLLVICSWCLMTSAYLSRKANPDM